MDYLNYSSNYDDDDDDDDDDDVDDVSVVNDDDNDEYSCEPIEINHDLLRTNGRVIGDLEFIANNNIDETFTNYTNSNIQTSLHAFDQNVDDDESSDNDIDSETKDDCNNLNINNKSDSSSSSSSDSESIQNNKNKSNHNYKKNILKIESFMTEEEEESSAIGPMKTKNEMEGEVEDFNIKKIDLELLDQLVTIGHVLYRIDLECVVVIQAAYTNNPLSEGSILCNKNGVVLGKIHEIFGPITTPFYTVRWKNIFSKNTNNMDNNTTNYKRNNSQSGVLNKNKKRKNINNNSKIHIQESQSYNNNPTTTTNNFNFNPTATNIATTNTSTSVTDIDTVNPLSVTIQDTLVVNDSGIESTLDTISVIDAIPCITSTTTTTKFLDDRHMICQNINILEGNHNDCNNNIDIVVVDEHNKDELTNKSNNSNENSAKLLDINNIQLSFPIGADVYTIKDQCTFVMPNQLRIMYGKGSDASNAYDEEPHENEIEYSDDEQELFAKQALNKSKKKETRVQLTSFNNNTNTSITTSTSIQVQNKHLNNITKKRTSNNNNNNNNQYVSNHLTHLNTQLIYNNNYTPNQQHNIYPTLPVYMNAHTGYHSSGANPLMPPNNSLYYHTNNTTVSLINTPYPTNYSAPLYPVYNPTTTIQQQPYYNPYNNNNNNISNYNQQHITISNNMNNIQPQASVPLPQYQYQPILFNKSNLNYPYNAKK